jgi:hypothetical protein
MRQPGLAVGLFVCNTKGTPGETGASTTELQMGIVNVKLDRSKLCGWYFAIGWARIRVQQRIDEAKGYGWETNYEDQQLERITEMEQFIKMTWDQVLDGDLPTQTAQEVK